MERISTEYGTAHCFSCGFAMKLPKFVGYCFDEDESFGEEWLLSRCSTAFISETKYLPEIVIDNNKYKNDTQPSMSEDELKKYAYYHEYMWKRKLSKEVVDRFEVGYDPKQNMLIFPVRDEKGVLRFVTGRSVLSHRFMIPPEIVWWSVFASEQEKFIRACKSIIERPRHRLHGQETYRRADQLKVVPREIENTLAEHRKENGHLYRVEEQIQTNDTQENRFLKFALSQIISKYDVLKRRIENLNNVSEVKKEEMRTTLSILKHLQRSPFFRTVGRKNDATGYVRYGGETQCAACRMRILYRYLLWGQASE